MIFRYPLFRSQRADFQQITMPHYGFDGKFVYDERLLHFHGMPPRFTRIDRRLISDRNYHPQIIMPAAPRHGDKVNICGVDYLFLNDTFDGIAFAAVRADPLIGRVLFFLDGIAYALCRAEWKLRVWLSIQKAKWKSRA